MKKSVMLLQNLLMKKSILGENGMETESEEEEKAINGLIAYYDKEEFQKELKNTRDELCSIFIDLIDYIKGKSILEENQLIFSAPEARVKSSKSLKEKIIRNNYYHEWKMEKDQSEEISRKQIITKLPDAVGLRISCYFYEDEGKIYYKILNDEEIRKFLNNKQVELTDGIIKKKNIYKYNGNYVKNGIKYNFEF